MRDKCIICGEKAVEEIKVGDISLHFCYNPSCKALFNYKVNGSFPIVFLCPFDSVEHQDTSNKVADYFNEHPEKFLPIATSVTGGLWDYEQFGETFSELTAAAATHMEKEFAENIPLDEIPIMIEHFNYPKAKEYLKQRLQDGN